MTADGNVMTAAITRLGALLEAGGIVMWPLLAVGLAVWTMIALRVMTLRDVIKAQRRLTGASGIIVDNESFALDLRLKKLLLRRNEPFIETLIAAAPLLGLLGTVSGMITTFEGLTSMALFSADGGIAGGIAEALTTTQAGLLIAIPAFFANKVVGRKVKKLEQRLEIAVLGHAARRTAPGGATP